jgi:hypothetical protein
MARLSRRPFLIGVRLLIACFVAFPACFIVWLCLFYLAVPSLLKANNVIPNYIGFYIQYPRLVGRVNNLQCTADIDGIVADGFYYFCRFNVKSANVEQFVRNMALSSGSTCNRLYEQAPEKPWWNPSEARGGQCYFRNHADHMTLLYSPTNQLAYIIDSDY